LIPTQPETQLHFGAGSLCSPERLNMDDVGLRVAPPRIVRANSRLPRRIYGTGRAPIVVRCEIKVDRMRSAQCPHPNETLILGSGEGGKYLAWHMAQP
jgi:hypothetical protein